MFELASDVVDCKKLSRELVNSGAGALVTFEGWVREHNDGKSVLDLEYEAYEPLCLKEAEKIIAEAHNRFDLLAVKCVHRTGKLKIGEVAVWVGVTAAHRDAAFAACRFVIDEVKTRLPIWKRETYDTGESGWINCQSCAAHHDLVRK